MLRQVFPSFGFSSLSDGQRFQEIAFKFEEQWQTAMNDNNEANLKELKNQMTENQRKRIDLIASALVELDFNELKYFELLLGERARQKNNDISLMSLYTDWAQVKRSSKKSLKKGIEQICLGRYNQRKSNIITFFSYFFYKENVYLLFLLTYKRRMENTCLLTPTGFYNRNRFQKCGQVV